MSSTYLRSLIALLFLGLVTAPVAWADDDDDDGDDDAASITEEFSEDLRHAVTLRATRRHQRAWQRIADRNDGVRAAGTPGYDESAEYVARRLSRAGYDVTLQEFTVPFFEEFSDPAFSRVSPLPITYGPPNDASSYFTSILSAAGTVVGEVVPVDIVVDPNTPPNTSTSGCEAEDFLSDPTDPTSPSIVEGKIALISRGTCFFTTKADNAEAAGAIGFIMFNEGQVNRTDAFPINLGAARSFVAFFTTFDIGAQLVDLAENGTEPVIVSMTVDGLSENRPTVNVLADTHNGNPDQTIVVGAHLDSVTEGPGIQDNGSGSAAILELARQLARYDRRADDDDDDDDDDDENPLRNRVRFAWWGGEELGLLGSQFYVDNLTAAEQAEIAMNLNFDMIGSPNFVRFVYDGNGDATPDPDGNPQPGPAGSDHIEQMYLNYFAEQGLPVEPTAFDGRSDYGPFIAPGVDIPAGGLFTGAEVLKTQALADIYGGTVGQQFDPCYHLACDTFDNISLEVFDQMIDAVAHSVAFYASRDDLFAPFDSVVASSGSSLSGGALAHDHDHHPLK